MARGGLSRFAWCPAALAVVLASRCTCGGADLNDLKFACNTDADCAAGDGCQDGVCVASAPMDAGSNDAGTSTDSGVDSGVDGGEVVDAGTDAGMDAGVDAGTDAGADAGLGFISVVQVNAHASDAGAATYTLPFKSSTDAGDLLVVSFDWSVPASLPEAFASISDSRGNAYLAAGSEACYVDHTHADSGWCARVFFAPDILGGPDAVTVTFDAGTSVELYIHEFHGANATAPLDVAAEDAGQTAGMQSVSAMAASPHDLVFAFCQTGTAGAGSGFTVLSNYDANVSEYENVSSAGTVTATVTTDSAWTLQMAAFRP